MDTLLNVRAFIAIAEAGSLSAAARRLNISTSVIFKRIGRLEDEVGAPLFVRTPRKAELTPLGERYLPRFRVLVQDFDQTLKGAKNHVSDLEGHLRLKSPTTIAIGYFGRFFREFQERHPSVSIELVLVDRSVSPVEEGFDLALGALPTSYPAVVDIPLCPHQSMLCASPAYLERAGYPEHPRDLAQHDCLSILPSGNEWLFESDQGELKVSVRPSFVVNDGFVLLDAVLHDAGIAVIASYLVKDSIGSGKLVQLLPDFPVKPLWLKALVPAAKLERPLIKALVEDLCAFTQPTAPWDRTPLMRPE